MSTSVPAKAAPQPALAAPVKSKAKPAFTPDRSPTGETQSLNSPGRPLDLDHREIRESRFGYDFSQMRVHSFTSPQESLRDVNAHADAQGPNRTLLHLTQRPEFASRKILRTDEARRVDHNDFRPAESAEAKDVLFGVPLGVDVSDSTRAEIPFGRLRQ